jgi:hypothetical protein
MLMEVLIATEAICARTASRNFATRDFPARAFCNTNTNINNRRPGAIDAPSTPLERAVQSIGHLHYPIAPSASSTAARIPVTIANMASKVTIDASATSKPKPSTAAPIEPLKNDMARLYTHVHPVIVLSLYAYKFKDIVADPVPALLNMLAPLAVLQIAYVALCLPPTGETPKVRKSKPGEKKRNAPGVLETGVNGTIVVCAPSFAERYPYSAIVSCS